MLKLVKYGLKCFIMVMSCNKLSLDLLMHKYLVIDKQVSASYQNQAINAIKFYNEHVLGLDRTYYEIDRPFKPKNLPRVLSQKDVQKILLEVKNIKHKAILSIIYGCGIRISECINMRLTDIDSDANRVWVRNAKGRKDRITLLPESLLTLLREYYLA